MKTDIFSVLQRLTPLRLWSMSVVLAVLITEIIVSVMGLLLKGNIPPDYLLTGLVASLFAASLVATMLNILFGALQESITERTLAAEILRKSAELIADIYHQAPCGYHSLDKDGIFKIINDTELAWLGYTRDEVIGKMKLTDLLTPAGIQIFREAFPRLKKQGFIRDLEIEITRKDGTTFVGLINATAIYDPSGNFVMSRSAVTDITAQKQAQAALRRSEENLNRAQAIGQIGSWFINIPGNRMEWSAEIYRMFGIPQQQGIDLETFVAAIHPDDRDFVMKAWGEAMAGVPYDIEHRIVVGGQVRWVRERAQIERDSEGKALTGIGTVQDITERKQAEQALYQQKNLLRQIIDSDPNMISVKDVGGRFLMVNQAMAAMHSKHPKDMIGQSGGEQFQIKENLTPILQADREVVETLRKVELVTHDFRNGKDSWFHITKVPMKQPDGTVHVLGIGVDITGKKLAEQQLCEHTAHIQTAREEEKASIAREIHDDLGGTLTALKMEFYWLASEATECKATPMLARIEAMSQLLDSATGITRRIICELHPTILDAFGLQAALEWQAGQFYKRTGIECSVICTQNDGCEPKLNKTPAINLFRIFQESLTNVTRHSAASKVEVEFHHGCEIMLSIRDNGCGLPEGHTIASTSYGMRGMTERVAQLGGKIKFDSLSSGGLNVTVKIPCESQKECAA